MVAVLAVFVEPVFECLLHFFGLAVQFAGLFFHAGTGEVFGGLVEVTDPLAVFTDHGFDFARFGRGGGKSAADEGCGDDGDEWCFHDVQGKRANLGTKPGRWKAGPEAAKAGDSTPVEPGSFCEMREMRARPSGFEIF